MKIQITNGMFIAMIVNVIFAKAIGVTQGVMARAVGQDMWIATLLATLQGLLVMYITYLIIRKAPNLDFITIAQTLLGRWFAKAVAALIFIFFLAAFGPIMITFVYHLQEYFLPESPITLFIVSSLLVGLLGCYYGLEVMARIAVIGLLFIFLLNALIILGSTQEFDIRNLLPVLESGRPHTIEASFHYDADWSLATMSAALIMPMLKNTAQRGGQLGMLGILLSGLLVVIWSILEGAVLSAEVTSQYTVSCMKLARNAHIGTFLQRYEMIMIALYSLSVLFEVMICLYGTSVSAAQIFGQNNSKAMIFPAGIVLGLFGYWIIEDHFRAMRYLEHYWPQIALSISVGLPLVLLGLVTLLGRKLKQAGSN